MTRPGVTVTLLLPILLVLTNTGCATMPTADACDADAVWPGELTHDDPCVREVTVIIALSSIVPGGVVGHTGIAVDQQYWDFGPQRVDRFQRLKSIRSDAGPWWDDPDQHWQTNRTLAQVAQAIPDKLHPAGSLVAVFRVEVTVEQAEAIAGFWDDTYARMRVGKDEYRLVGRQCANMVGWSLAYALSDLPTGEQPLPDELRMMTPSRLYEKLRDKLRHTAGARAGEPADLTLWQLGHDGLTLWQRPAVWEGFGVPELPRLRLAFERVKHLPVALISGR